MKQPIAYNIKTILIKNLTLFTFFSFINIYAQTPSDALMMKNKELCIAAVFNHDNWDQYWEGNLLRTNGNIGQFKKNAYNGMFGYGISDRLNAFVNLPYIHTSSTGGQMKGVNGIQDLSLALKYRFFTKTQGNEKLKLSVYGTGGFSMPLSSYLSDYLPFALGLGTLEFTGRIIPEVRFKDNLYFRSSIAYSHRATTKAERNYYYNEQGYYTNIMDVPDVFSFDIAFGTFLFEHNFQVECTFSSQTSLSGDDIRRQNNPQPTNKMDVGSISAYLRYFPSFTRGFSVFTSYNHVLIGRNVGQSRIYSAGFTYQFRLDDQNQEQK